MTYQSAPDNPITAAVYQSGLAGASLTQKLDRLSKAIAASPRADLVVCPELFLSDYQAGELLPQRAGLAEAFFRDVAGIAKASGCAIAYGYPEAKDGRLYNSALVVGADGRILANHRKLRLPSDYERTWFTCGDELTDFDLNGWRVALLICYDIEFPELVRACALRGAHLAIAPTALSEDWPMVAQKVVPTRAFENGMFVAYANHCGRDGELRYLGGSCIVGPDGRDRVRAGGEEGLHAAVLLPQELRAARGKLTYLEDTRALAGILRKGAGG